MVAVEFVKTDDKSILCLKW